MSGHPHAHDPAHADAGKEGPTVTHTGEAHGDTKVPAKDLKPDAPGGDASPAPKPVKQAPPHPLVAESAAFRGQVRDIHAKHREDVSGLRARLDDIRRRAESADDVSESSKAAIDGNLAEAEAGVNMLDSDTSVTSSR